MAKDSKRKCPDCYASLSIYDVLDKGDGKCAKCNGTGEVADFIDNTCRVCSGTGQCQTCGGTGYEYYTEVEDNLGTNENDFSISNSDSDRNNPEYDIIRAAVERKMANEVSWFEFLFWHLPKLLFWRFPLFLSSSIADLFRKPATNDELYQMIVRVLIIFRQTTNVKTQAGFVDCIKNLQSYVDVRRDEDKKRLDHSQRIYVDTVRRKCELKAEILSEIIDKLIPALDIPDLPRACQFYNELDSVFRPPDGGDGWDVFVRAAQSS